MLIRFDPVAKERMANSAYRKAALTAAKYFAENKNWVMKKNSIGVEASSAYRFFGQSFICAKIGRGMTVIAFDSILPYDVVD